MDPNLTLAHITHNTSVILLHQGIAYPPLHWRTCPVRLPSASSAETCIEAASEISTIVHQFLRHSGILASPQFSFCLFVAGRVLLTHSAYNKTSLPPELQPLISSLLEISKRWAGPFTGSHENLAYVFAKRLIRARDKSSPAVPRTNLDIRQTAYSEPTEEDSCQTSGLPGEEIIVGPEIGDSPSSNPLSGGQYITTPSLAFPPLPLSFQQLPYQQQLFQAQPLDPPPFPTPDPSNAILDSSMTDSGISDHVILMRDPSSGNILSPTSYRAQSGVATPSKPSHMSQITEDVSNSMSETQWHDRLSGFLDLPFGPSQRISRYGKIVSDSSILSPTL